jgi:hypothetical protein
MATGEQPLSFGWKAYLVLVLPLAVIGFGGLFISVYGYPIDFLAAPLIPDGHAEAAARLRVLATFCLLFALAIACLAYFVTGLRDFHGADRQSLLVAWPLLAAIGIGSVALGLPEEAQRFIGEREVCASFEFLEKGSKGGTVGVSDAHKLGGPRTRSGGVTPAWEATEPPPHRASSRSCAA